MSAYYHAYVVVSDPASARVLDVPELAQLLASRAGSSAATSCDGEAGWLEHAHGGRSPAIRVSSGTGRIGGYTGADNFTGKLRRVLFHVEADGLGHEVITTNKLSAHAAAMHGIATHREPR